MKSRNYFINLPTEVRKYLETRAFNFTPGDTKSKLFMLLVQDKIPLEEYERTLPFSYSVMMHRRK